jgi:hypothetical protein
MTSTHFPKPEGQAIPTHIPAITADPGAVPDDASLDRQLRELASKYPEPHLREMAQGYQWFHDQCAKCYPHHLEGKVVAVYGEQVVAVGDHEFVMLIELVKRYNVHPAKFYMTYFGDPFGPEPPEPEPPPATAAEAIGRLLNSTPPPGKDVVWLGDEVVAVAQHMGSVTLEVVREGDNAWALVCRSDPPPAEPIRLTEHGPLYLFRPLMARLAVMCSEETATEFQPYGGNYTLRRSSRDGPVRLDIIFTNTTSVQHLTITRTLLPRPGC